MNSSNKIFLLRSENSNGCIRLIKYFCLGAKILMAVSGVYESRSIFLRMSKIFFQLNLIAAISKGCGKKTELPDSSIKFNAALSSFSVSLTCMI
jgi:hypothetical protein